MEQVTHRDQRIVDAAITQNLASSPSFWASTTILVPGGLLAVLGTNERRPNWSKTCLSWPAPPCSSSTSRSSSGWPSTFTPLPFYLVHASLFGAILVGSAPNVDVFD